MDYTGGIDIDQRENGPVSTEPAVQIAPSGAPPHIRPPGPPLPTRIYPSAAGGPYNQSPWPNNSAATASRTTLPPSKWPPPPNWVPPAPYHGANFPQSYSGSPTHLYTNTPPPSYHRPPPTQPSGPPTPGEYAWNPSLGPISDPSPHNAPAASPGPAKASADPSTTSRGRRKQGRHSKDALQSRESSQGGRLESQANIDMEEEEEDGMEGKEGPKSGRNRAMFANEKLALVGICAEYADEYAMNQRQKYWGKIAYLLKEKTGYVLKSPRLTVERWIRAQMGEHTLDRLGFTTQAELDEFHTAISRFGERWQAIAGEKEQLQKSQAAMFASEKITKLQKENEVEFDPALLQKRLVSKIGDEPIPTTGLENPVQMSKGRNTPSVFHNGSLKRRRLEDSSYQLRETAELMVAGMKDSIGALAEGLRQSAEAVVGDREMMDRIEDLEKSSSDTHAAVERNSKAIGDLSARLTVVEAGVKTFLEFLTKKMDDVDNNSSPTPARQAQ